MYNVVFQIALETDLFVRRILSSLFQAKVISMKMGKRNNMPRSATTSQGPSTAQSALRQPRPAEPARAACRILSALSIFGFVRVCVL